MNNTANSIFDQHYRIVAVDSDRLLVPGIVNGEVLASLIRNPMFLFRKKTSRLEN